MKFLPDRYSSICMVCSDDEKIFFGLVGTVGDFVKANLPKGQ